MTVTAAELKQLTMVTTENSVRQYKAIYVAGRNSHRRASRQRANSFGMIARNTAPLKHNVVVNKSRTYVAAKDTFTHRLHPLRAMESRRLRPVVRSRRRFLADRFAGTAKAPDFSLIP